METELMPYAVKYPRRKIIRGGMRLLGRGLATLLADPKISGSENFPKHGPLIVVGNHTAAMEVVMMTIFTPWFIEYMGSTDIPHECYIAFFNNVYGFIPVFRGNVSRSAMEAGLDVLSQDGILGIFPEGGIWEPNIRRAHSGVAWLSYRSKAPVLPIGFGSMQGAMNQLFTLKRPTLKMNVGRVLPAVQISERVPRKVQLQNAADRIMDAVWDLIPVEDRQQEKVIWDERFELTVRATDAQDDPIDIPKGLQPEYGSALSKFIHRTTLINNFISNLELPVQPLKQLADQPELSSILKATDSILEYLQTDNPYYFTYRYGQREGQAMENGIRELQALTRWAIRNENNLVVTPNRRFYIEGTDQEVILDRPDEFKKW